MGITPELQFIVIVSSVAVLLIIAAAIIFYRLGKRSKEIVNENKIINEKKNIPSADQGKDTLKAARDNSANPKVSIIDADKMMLYQQKKEKKINPSELYEKKIEDEISNKEKNNAKRDENKDLKFLKYTSEGYKPAKGDKDPKNLGWR